MSRIPIFTASLPDSDSGTVFPAGSLRHDVVCIRPFGTNAYAGTDAHYYPHGTLSCGSRSAGIRKGSDLHGASVSSFDWVLLPGNARRRYVETIATQEKLRDEAEQSAFNRLAGQEGMAEKESWLVELVTIT